MPRLIAITDDGIRVYAGRGGRWGWQVWGERDGERIEFKRVTITRRMDPRLPPGEHPADLVDYDPARPAAL